MCVSKDDERKGRWSSDIYGIPIQSFEIEQDQYNEEKKKKERRWDEEKKRKGSRSSSTTRW